MKDHSLDCFFKPASVAIIGASGKEKSIGHALVQNFIESDFSGKVYPINPRYSVISGIETYPTIAAVNAPIDLAIIAIPIKAVPNIIKDCGQAGIKGAIIVSRGGKEAGEEGAKIEAAIKKEASHAGVRYLGPKCTGINCPPHRLNASLLAGSALPGSLAFVSQSEAVTNSILGWAALKNIGFSHLVSVGSMTDLDFGDMIDYLGNDEKVKSILIYMESLTQHRKFLSAARSVSRVKPIIVIKAGRSPAGASASVSHTGSLSREDSAYDAAFRRAGIIRVDTIGQLFDCAEALGKTTRPVGNSLGIVTNGGGIGVMAVDALSRWNIEPAILGPESVAKLEEFLPEFCSRRNPMDISGDATPERHARAVRVCMEAPELSGLAIMLSPQPGIDAAAVARAIVPEVKGKARPVFAVWMGGPEVAEGVQILNEAGIPTFETPEAAVDTFVRMYSHARHLELLQETPPRLPRELNIKDSQARSFIEQCLAKNARLLSELESKAVLSAYGIPVNHTVAASSGADAASKAREIGFPVVLKLNSPDISHKSDPGGVVFNLQDEQEVISAYDRIVAEAQERQPDALILGVTVQTQVEQPDLELFIGSKQDPDFGPVIFFGLGGVLTEVLNDWAVDLAPLNLLLARQMIQKTRVYRVLQGYRHISPANVDLLAEILVRVSQLVTDFPEIVELDINPLILNRDGTVAADARLVVEPSTVSAPRHLAISPYPNQYESDWMLRDGTPALLRPVKPEDEPLAHDFLSKCSEDTVYFRYFRRIRKFTHEMLIRFTQNDYDREISLVAVGQPPAPEVILGMGHLFMDSSRETGEFAIMVGDQWQGNGLGSEIVGRLIDVAREQGVQRLWGEILAQNQPMLEMAKKMGFTVTKDIENQTCRVEMELAGFKKSANW
ncbi:MAG: bifunctional acetate--CoA ligase family protein/GNAT family N-acetyltransferase [Deltaproteobacteria bacterium]|nr:bifunctional acetate--CoA ligase family protein/GNAT family N-acetyltransferase [Deltaproteobacteria bacterium]